MIKYCKTYTSNKKKVLALIENSIDSNLLTNNGPLVMELESKLCEFLNVKNVICVTNGTVAIQLLLKALFIKNNVITTPFTYIATSSSIKWEGLNLKYSDIDEKTFNLNPDNIRHNLNSNSCIIPVHVFGNPCYVEKFEKLRKENGVKVIYDAAHAFGVKYKGNSVLNYGDASTISFHATKVFHTVEGGAVVTNNDDLADSIRNFRAFGFKDGIFGINAKMSEINAAFGLSNLEDIDIILKKRKEVFDYYEINISNKFKKQYFCINSTNNYGYYPILFKNEEKRNLAYLNLLSNGVETRKYFHPSLDTLFLQEGCKNSNNIANSILCLPIYPDLKAEELSFICNLINKQNE